MISIINKKELESIIREVASLSRQLDYANKDIIKLQAENRRLHKRLIKKRNEIEYGITARPFSAPSAAPSEF